MREIKFRAWDPEAQRMMDFEEIKQTTLYHLRNAKDELGWETMQFTGLLDKNKKEIYEGDIIKQDSEWRGNPTYEVKFERGEFVGVRKDGHGSSLWACVDVKFYVIGNIYENPKLLRGGE